MVNEVIHYSQNCLFLMAHLYYLHWKISTWTGEWTKKSGHSNNCPFH